MENSTLVYAVFILVYLGMIFDRLPWLALDRTGIVTLGAIALLASGQVSLRAAGQASIHPPFCFSSASW